MRGCWDHSNSVILQAQAVLGRSQGGNISIIASGGSDGGGVGWEESGPAIQQSSSRAAHFQNHIYESSYWGQTQQKLQASEGWRLYKKVFL